MSTRRLPFQRSYQIIFLSPSNPKRSPNCRISASTCVRAFSASVSDSNESSADSTGVDWRKKQLDKLTRKFTEPKESVENDEDLQPMWKEMEGRVTRRRPRTVEEMGGKTGRVNVRKTDEEMWLREGLYDESAPKS